MKAALGSLPEPMGPKGFCADPLATAAPHTLLVNDFYHPQAVALEGEAVNLHRRAIAFESSDEDIGLIGASKAWPVNCLGCNATRPTAVLCKRSLRCSLGDGFSQNRCAGYTPFVHDSPALFVLCHHFRGGLQCILLSYVAFYLGVPVVKKKLPMPFYIDLLHRFQSIHVAYFLGVYDFLRGRNVVVWTPRGGNVSSV